MCSFFKIRCEKAYRRFFIPRLRGDTGRGDEGGGEARGRAKGYAGTRLAAFGREELEVKGMEARQTTTIEHAL